jgi:hypothetical protein
LRAALPRERGSADNRRVHTQPRALSPELIAALALACAASVFTLLNHDVGWYLVESRRMLGGERLYVDILDPNPPVILWLLALPVWIGSALSLSDRVTANLLPALCLVPSTLLAASVLALPPAAARWQRSSLLCGFLFLSTGCSLLDMGQRDQLAGILFLPYALVAARAAAGLESPNRVAILCGLLAAPGLAMKPYFVLPWLGVELVIVLRRRSLRALWRADCLTLALGFSALAALVLAFTPEFVTRNVPVALAIYDGYNISRWYLATVWTVLSLWMCLFGALAIERGLLEQGAVRVTETLAAAGFGFLFSFLWQAKGFGYHLIPGLQFSALALLAVSLQALPFAAESLRGDAPARARGVRLVLACVASGFLCVVFVAHELRTNFRVLRGGYSPEVRELVSRVKTFGPGAPILSLSASLSPAFPVVNLAGASWPYHYSCLWPLPGIYRGTDHLRAPESQGPIERELFETVVGDFVATPPRLLLVDRSVWKIGLGGAPFDYVTYFSASPAFAERFREYQLVGHVGDFDLYERTIPKDGGT